MEKENILKGVWWDVKILQLALVYIINRLRTTFKNYIKNYI